VGGDAVADERPLSAIYASACALVSRVEKVPYFFNSQSSHRKCKLLLAKGFHFPFFTWVLKKGATYSTSTMKPRAAQPRLTHRCHSFQNLCNKRGTRRVV
jgi:hypothetical protein